MSLSICWPDLGLLYEETTGGLRRSVRKQADIHSKGNRLFFLILHSKLPKIIYNQNSRNPALASDPMLRGRNNVEHSALQNMSHRD